MKAARCWPLAAALAVASALVAPADAATDTISFAEPARLQHEQLAANGTWFGVMIPAGSTVEGHLALDGNGSGSVKRDLVFHGEAGWAPVPTLYTFEPDEDAPEAAPQNVSLQATQGTASLWFEARHADIATGTGTSLLAAHELPCMTALAGDDAAGGLSRQFSGTACIHMPSAYLVGSGNIVTWVQVRAVGVSSLGLHNMTVVCDIAQCIHGGGFERMGTPSALPGSAWIDRYQYAEYAGVNATLDMVFPAAWLAVGGPSLDVGFTGTARLAQAAPTNCEHHCWMDGDGTAALQGTILLSKVQPAPGGRLSAQLSGEIASARLDEAPVVSFALVDAVAVTGAIAVLLGMLKLGAALLTRRSNPLKHPNRRSLYEAVQAHPGATFRELVRRTGIPTGTARHHLQVLAQANVISIRPHKETLRHFDNHGQFDDSWQVVTLLREPDLRALCEWLADNPGVHQRGIMEASTQWGWSRSTTQHRLRRLEAENLVTMTPRGRFKCYSLSPATSALLADDGLHGPGAPAGRRPLGQSA